MTDSNRILRDVFPCQSLTNETNGGETDTIILCDGRVRPRIKTNFYYISFGELCFVVLRATMNFLYLRMGAVFVAARVSPLANHVMNVVSKSAEKKVRDFYAWSTVTCVQHAHAFWH